MSDLKESTESLEISLRDNNFSEEELESEEKPTKKKKKTKKDIIVKPLLNCVVSTYYKGTGIEEVLKKLEKYVEETTDVDLSEVNSI